MSRVYQATRQRKHLESRAPGYLPEQGRKAGGFRELVRGGAGLLPRWSLTPGWTGRGLGTEGSAGSWPPAATRPAGPVPPDRPCLPRTRCSSSGSTGRCTGGLSSSCSSGRTTSGGQARGGVQAACAALCALGPAGRGHVRRPLGRRRSVSPSALPTRAVLLRSSSQGQPLQPRAGHAGGLQEGRGRRGESARGPPAGSARRAGPGAFRAEAERAPHSVPTVGPGRAQRVSPPACCGGRWSPMPAGTLSP